MMRREFLNYFSSWDVIFLITLLFITVAVVFYIVSHRYFSSVLIKQNTHNTASVYNILTISVVLMAFTIVVLWQFFVHVKETVIHESTELQQIIGYSQGFPHSTTEAVKDSVGHYVAVVVDKEWPAMRVGHLDPNDEGRQILKQLFSIFLQHPPANENERILYGKFLESHGAVLSDRDIRLDATESAIPTYFFRVIMINLVLLVLSVCLLDERGHRAPFFISILVATIAGINLGLTFSLDYPFSGEHSISSEYFTRDVLGELYQAHKSTTQG